VLVLLVAGVSSLRRSNVSVWTELYRLSAAVKTSHHI